MNETQGTHTILKMCNVFDVKCDTNAPSLLALFFFFFLFVLAVEFSAGLEISRGPDCHVRPSRISTSWQ